MRLIDADALLKIMETWDWQELYLPIFFKEMGIDKAQTVEPEPVYFPPCFDCQNRSKEILTAYNNMKKMQAYTKKEVIALLTKLQSEIEEIVKKEKLIDNKWANGLHYSEKIIQQKINALKAESEEQK